MEIVSECLNFKSWDYLLVHIGSLDFLLQIQIQTISNGSSGSNIQLSIPLNRVLVITPSSLRTITALKQEFKFRTGFLIGQNVIYVNLRHLWSHNGNLLMRKSWNFLVDGLGRIKIQNNIFRPRVVAKERDHIYFYCYCMVAIQRTAV